MQNLYLIFFLLPFLGLAQPGFNKIYDVTVSNPHFRDMIVHDDTIVGYGMAIVNTDPWLQGIIVAQFDTSGTLLNWNTFTEATGESYSMDKPWGKITHSPDGGYALNVSASQKKSPFD